MIRVELGEEVRKRGKWRWSVRGGSLRGVSRQPILDACRELKRSGEAGDALVGLFREGRSVPDLTCRLDWGAGHTVVEDDFEPIRFKKFRPGPAERARQKKEG